MPDTGKKTSALFILPAILLLLYSVTVIRVPLLNYLGYEFATATAMILPLVPGLFVMRYFRRKMTESGGPVPGIGPYASFLTAIGASMVVLAVPLAIGWLNGFFVKNCAPADGLSYYLLIPAVTMVWVVSLALFCSALFRRPLFWYAAIVVLTLLYPLYLGYATPRIDSYNFIYGYFPGFTYDEDLRITSTLVLFRVMTLVAALFLLTAGAFAFRRKGSGRENPTAPALLRGIFVRGRLDVIVPALVLALGWWFRVEMGFETTRGRIETALGSIAETKHFRICYDSAVVSAGEIRWVAAEHEFRFSQVAAALEVDTNIIVTSYLYPDTDTKRTLMGAGNTDIAKPWRSEIHLDHDSWKATLKHELVHILAGEFGMPVIRANTNIALVEGLATALSPSFGNHSLAEYSAAMIRFGVVEDPGALVNTAGFAFQSSTVSYVIMGSFCEFLIGKYGIAPFKKWYGGESPDSAYGKDTGALVGEWEASLRRIRVPEEWKPHVVYFFRRPSIFAKECARYIANLNREGYRSLGKKDFRGAIESFKEALWESWNTSSFTGLTRALLYAGDFNQVVRRFEMEMTDTSRRKSLTGANFILGDALMMRGDYLLAGMVFRDLYNLHLSPGADEAAALRLTIIGDAKIRGYLAPYLAGEMTDTSALMMLEKMKADSLGPVIPYLAARIHISKKDYLPVILDLIQFGAVFEYPELNAGAQLLLADAFFGAGEFLALNEYSERSLAYLKGRAAADRVADRIARGTWFYREWGKMDFRVSGR